MRPLFFHVHEKATIHVVLARDAEGSAPGGALGDRVDPFLVSRCLFRGIEVA